MSWDKLLSEPAFPRFSVGNKWLCRCQDPVEHHELGRVAEPQSLSERERKSQQFFLPVPDLIIQRLPLPLLYPPWLLD
ncbi:hypothetical protein H8959_016262 [Pygathrix nigripes]